MRPDLLGEPTTLWGSSQVDAGMMALRTDGSEILDFMNSQRRSFPSLTLLGSTTQPANAVTIWGTGTGTGGELVYIRHDAAPNWTVYHENGTSIGTVPSNGGAILGMAFCWNPVDGLLYFFDSGESVATSVQGARFSSLDPSIGGTATNFLTGLGFDHPVRHQPVVTPDGSVWVYQEPYNGSAYVPRILRWDGTTLHTYTTGVPVLATSGGSYTLVPRPNNTVWQCGDFGSGYSDLGFQCDTAGTVAAQPALDGFGSGITAVAYLTDLSTVVFTGISDAESPPGGLWELKAQWHIGRIVF